MWKTSKERRLRELNHSQDIKVREERNKKQPTRWVCVNRTRTTMTKKSGKELSYLGGKKLV